VLNLGTCSIVLEALETLAWLSHQKEQTMILKFPKSKRSAFKEWEEHQKQAGNYFSRREFLERGLVGFSGLLVAPSVLSLMLKSENAYAAVTEMKKVFILDMPGGAGFGPEVVFLKPDGRIPNGSLFPATGAPVGAPTSDKYGAQLWRDGLLFRALEGTSPIAIGNNGGGNLSGIVTSQLSVASNLVKTNLRIIVLQHPRSLDDVAGNKTLNTQAIAQAAVIAGMNTKVKGGLQSRSLNSDSGGFAQPTFEISGMKPAQADSLASIENLLKLQQGALKDLRQNQLQSLAKASLRFSEIIKGKKRGSTALGDKVAQNAQTLKNLADVPPSVDPNLDNVLRTQFDLANQRQLVMAANVSAVLQGLAPVAVFSETSQFYDYHDSTDNWKRDQHPLMIDQTIRILNSMADKNQSGIVAWHTNGGISYGPNQVAMGDGAAYHSAVFFVLSMGDTPKPERFYLGCANNEGGGESDPAVNILAKAPEYEGHALLANMLSQSGVLKSDFQKYCPSNIPLADFKALSVFKG